MMYVVAVLRERPRTLGQLGIAEGDRSNAPQTLDDSPRPPARTQVGNRTVFSINWLRLSDAQHALEALVVSFEEVMPAVNKVDQYGLATIGAFAGPKPCAG